MILLKFLNSPGVTIDAERVQPATMHAPKPGSLGTFFIEGGIRRSDNSQNRSRSAASIRLLDSN
jgi:hypothetical protein